MCVGRLFGVGKPPQDSHAHRVNRLPLEDNYTDVIGKAQRGLGIDNASLARKSGVSVETVGRVKSGEVDSTAIAAIAPHLNLDGPKLVAMAQGKWYPEIPSFPEGFAMFTTKYPDMTVNSYLVWDPSTRDAIAFDTGATCEGMLADAKARGLKIRMILLTHSHDDHIDDLPCLRTATGAPVFLSSRGSLPGATPVAEGHEFTLGRLRIRALHTYGHASDGSTFIVEGLHHPLAIVGDSLFASSMGGGLVSHDDAFRNNVDKIFKLSDDTVIASGHGPLTTVGQERRHNPFFAGRT